MNIITVIYHVLHTRHSVFYHDILFCSPLDTHCVCVSVIMYVIHTHIHTHTHTHTVYQHRNVLKPHAARCMKEPIRRVIWCAAQSTMHFAHGVSWDACSPGVVAPADKQTHNKRSCYHSVSHAQYASNGYHCLRIGYTGGTQRGGEEGRWRMED